MMIKAAVGWAGGEGSYVISCFHAIVVNVVYKFTIIGGLVL